ncbi:MAG TPA: hypothetical protein VM344_07185 [Vitreimonas sp.]|jgi:hypothetical protein|nr:hypothetical protein [Vitreimonas sp.]
MAIHPRLLDLLAPLTAVGVAALAARLIQPGESSTPALYLAPLGLAVLTGFWRPSLLGTVGAWVGWSAGVTLASLFDTGEIALAGTAAYGLVAAFAPHAAGSLIRVLFRPPEHAASG